MQQSLQHQHNQSIGLLENVCVWLTSLSTEPPIILHETAGNANLDPAKGLTRHKGINKEITELVTAAGTEPLWLVAWSKVQKQQQ